MSRCVITGCCLVVLDEKKWMRGDLFDCISYWVFAGNTTGNMMREADWQFDPPQRTEKQLIVEGPYFEKRGILTVHKENCCFNDAAANYLMI